VWLSVARWCPQYSVQAGRCHKMFSSRAFPTSDRELSSMTLTFEIEFRLSLRKQQEMPQRFQGSGPPVTCEIYTNLLRKFWDDEYTPADCCVFMLCLLTCLPSCSDHIFSLCQLTTLTIHNSLSLFHSWLTTYLFHKSFPPQTPFRPQNWLHRLYDRTVSSEHLGFYSRPRITPAIAEDCYILVVLFLWASYGIGQTIIFSSCGFFFFFLLLSFFPGLISAVSVCLSYFHTWCGFIANLGCRSETCCTRGKSGNLKQ